MSIEKLSDLTGNPWDDLTQKQQQRIIHNESVKTYRNFQNNAEDYFALDVKKRVAILMVEEMRKLEGVFRRFLWKRGLL